MRIIRQEQFADFIAEHERLVLSICFSFTNNYFDAEDLAQDTFLSFYKNRNRFDGKNPKAYLTVIAANKCRDFLRRAERSHIPLPEEDEIPEDASASPEEITAGWETSEHVLACCRKLKEPYREVAIGYFCREEKLSDMARRTGQNLKTLQTQLYRAKSQLKSLWKEDFI